MFGFFSKFKTDVVSGFDAVHQRLVTLEAKVEALFHHASATATAVKDAPVEVAAAVESEVKAVVDSPAAAVEAVKTVATDAVEAVKNAS